MSTKKPYELEFLIRSSPGILFNFIYTPSGLSEWFADNVNVQDGIYDFTWDGNSEKAKLVKHKQSEFVRYKWLDSEDDDSYFEMRVKIDEITGDVALIITDFSEEDELEENKLLWDAQVADLMKRLGS